MLDTEINKTLLTVQVGNGNSDLTNVPCIGLLTH